MTPTFVKRGPALALPTESVDELPADLARVVLSRVRFLAGTVAGSLVLYLVYMLALPADSPTTAWWAPRAGTLLVAVMMSSMVLAITYLRELPAARIVALGLMYEVALATCFSLFRHGQPWGPDEAYREWSPNAVLMITFAMLLPARPRTVLVTALVCAATEPVALGLSVLRGLPAPTLHQCGMLMLTPFVAAVMSYFGASIVYSLGRSLEDARRIGGYELIERIGSGGMGEVWLAKHRMLARPAAVKLIQPQALAGDPELRREVQQRFQREAHVTAALTSPHTVAIFDHGVAADGSFYYVMERLVGLDLETLVQQFGPLPPNRVVHLLMQACESLGEAHRHELIHRDVKPANLFVCRLGSVCDFVKVLDFGLVKTINRGGPQLTNDGTMPGTPGYIAPESIVGKDVDGRADVYALGCVAYFLLTGRLVFSGISPMGMIMAHAQKAPKPPSIYAKQSIPEGLDRLVLECLQKEPADRPSAEDLQERLAELDVGAAWSHREANAWWRTHLPSYVGVSVPVDTEARTIPLGSGHVQRAAGDDGDTTVDNYGGPTLPDPHAKTPRV